ncbi:competence pheromone ComX [Halobacillus salinarum]|uniref:ComX pheromone n=1 Tax=Halobacillus salinarum TaxID=2932257 RepID=A0ABY4EIG2_9BACI|nr:competence pheromone ComX [Halobacillus salinarum]UOQ43924.1 competence pheromone ComX [Halobacillus salinarum]
MLKNMMEYVGNHPNLLEKLENGQLSLVGVSELEKTALLDVLRDEDQNGLNIEMCYWK